MIVNATKVAGVCQSDGTIILSTTATSVVLFDIANNVVLPATYSEGTEYVFGNVPKGTYVAHYNGNGCDEYKTYYVDCIEPEGSGCVTNIDVNAEAICDCPVLATIASNIEETNTNLEGITTQLSGTIDVEVQNFPVSQNVVITNTPSVNATIVGQPISITGITSVVLPPVLYDALGRLRISEPKTLFECSFEYDAQPLMFDTLTSGAATVTHSVNTKMISVAATAVGNKAVYQSKQYVTYQAGKSLLVVLMGQLTTDLANTGTTKFGYFDDYIDKTSGAIGGNGIFYEYSSSTVKLVLRSYTSGSQVDTVVPQSSWNTDKVDGTGPSGIAIDFSKVHTYWFDLGGSKIRCGVIYGTEYIITHIFSSLNYLTVPPIQSANLPIRWEAKTSAGQTAACTFVGGSAVSEGGYSIRGKFRSFDNGFTGLGFGATLAPILTIRKKSTYNRMAINLVDANLIISTNDDIGVQFIINGTTGGTYTSIAADSAIEQCVGTTGGLALSGGIVVSSRVFQNDVDTLVTRFENNIKLWSKIAGESDTFTMAARNLTGGTANIFYTLGWQEWF